LFWEGGVLGRKHAHCPGSH